MDGISNLVGGSDNLWKYLFTSGVVLFVLSIAYPLQQQQKLSLKILEFEKEANILEKKINFLKQDIKQFSLYNDEVVNEIDSLFTLGNEKTEVDNAKLSELETSYSNKRISIKERSQQADILLVDLNSKEDYILEFKKQSDEFSFYFRLSFWLGIFLGVVGLYNWIWLTYIVDCINKKQLTEEDKAYYDKVGIRGILTKICSLLSEKKDA